MNRLLVCVLMALAAAAGTPELVAEEATSQAETNGGQETLDKAIEAKLGASSLDDLENVIKLCQQAIDEGLDEANADFARQLMAATRIQRGSALAETLLRPGLMQPGSNWSELRKLALEDLEKGLEYDDNHPQALLLVAQLNGLPGGDPERAREAVELALEKAGDNQNLKAQAYLLRAQMVEDPQQKIADLGKAAELLPDNPVPLRLRGLLHGQEEEYEKALADFDAALQLDPGHAGTHVAKIDCLIELERYDDAMKVTDRLEEILPQQSIAWFQRARITALQEKLDESLGYLEKALELDENDVKSLLLRAAIYQEQEKTDEALADLDKAIRLQPENSRLVQMRAALLAGTGKFREAIEALEATSQRQPQDTETLLQLAIMYNVEKYYGKAIEKFTQVLQAEPDNVVALRGRADALLTTGRQAEALADYERLLKLAPEDPGVLNNLAWILCTSPKDELRDGERALELAKKACELTNYEEAHILSTLGAAYAELGDFETAIEWSKKAIAAESEDPERKEALEKELETYQHGEPVRELIEEPLQPEDAEPGDPLPPDPEKDSQENTDGDKEQDSESDAAPDSSDQQ